MSDAIEKAAREAVSTVLSDIGEENPFVPETDVKLVASIIRRLVEEERERCAEIAALKTILMASELNRLRALLHEVAYDYPSADYVEVRLRRETWEEIKRER